MPPRGCLRREDLVERYTAWVRRCPSMTNAELARELGMTERALEQALRRARRAGRLAIRRRTIFTSAGPRIEVVP